MLQRVLHFKIIKRKKAEAEAGGTFGFENSDIEFQYMLDDVFLKGILGIPKTLTADKLG